MEDNHFYNETAALNYVENILWSNGVNCIHCGNKRIYSLKGNSHRIGLKTCSDCKKQFTVRIGTIFEDSRLPLVKWFLAIYLFSSLKKGLSSIQLAKYISVTQKTAWFMLQRIREVMKDGNGGGGLMNGVVEIDKSKKQTALKQVNYYFQSNKSKHFIIFISPRF